MRRQMGKNDWVFLGILTAAALIFLLIFLALKSEKGNLVTITLDGEVYGVYDLNEDQEVPIEKDGAVCNIVCICGGQAFMKEANCPDHLCIRQGKISADHATVVCLPNRVVVEVSSSDEMEFDSVAR